MQILAKSYIGAPLEGWRPLGEIPDPPQKCDAFSEKVPHHQTEFIHWTKINIMFCIVNSPEETLRFQTFVLQQSKYSRLWSLIIRRRLWVLFCFSFHRFSRFSPWRKRAPSVLYVVDTTIQRTAVGREHCLVASWYDEISVESSTAAVLCKSPKVTSGWGE